MKLSLYGKCSVNYYSSSVGENQYLLQKNIDLNSCPESLGRWRTFIDIPSCPGQEEQVTKYITFHRAFLTIDEIDHCRFNQYGKLCNST